MWRNSRREACLQFCAQALQRARKIFENFTNLLRFGYVDFKDLSGAKNAFKLHGSSFHGRAIEIDTDSGKAKAGYRARGDWENHTQFNEKINKTIKKTKEIEQATSKIKNFNPLKKSEKFEAKDRLRTIKNSSEEAKKTKKNATFEDGEGTEDI